MSDILRLVRLPENGRRRPLVLKDLADGVNWIPVRDTQTITPPPARPVTQTSDRRYSGSRQVGSAHDNGSFTRSFKVKGGSAQAVLANIEALIQHTEDYDGKYLEWRADGAPRSTFYELRGAAAWTPKYSWAQFVGAGSLEVDVTFPIAPLARGDALDYWEDWSVSTALSDWTFDAGAAGDLAIANGQVTGAASLATEKRLRYTGRGHVVVDHQEAQRFRTPTGAAPTGFKVSVTIKAIDAANYLEAGVIFDGTNWRFFLQKVIAGSATSLVNSVIGGGLSAATWYWLRARAEGNSIASELFPDTASALPPSGQASTSLPTASYLLGTAGATEFWTFGLGTDGLGVKARGGRAFVPIDAGAALGLSVSEPCTWRSRNLPESLVARAVPGDAPPLMDLYVNASGGTAPPLFALLAWARRNVPYNLIWNGDFEANTTAGWSTAAVLGLAAATSIAPVSTAAHDGTYSGQVVCPATSDSGVNFPIYRRFKAGVSYTFTVWVRSASQTTLIRARFGVTGDYASGAQPALTTAWQQLSVTWTPTADHDVAYAFVGIGAATATTFQLDGATAYEGATAPTSWQQSQGRGALPPVGILKCEGQYVPDLSGWAITADANYLGGFGLKVTTAGASSAQATYLVDPALLYADEFVHGEAHVEAWLVYELAAGVVAPRLTLSALPESAGAERYTSEFGQVGKALVRPASGTVKRMTRLGVLRFPVDSSSTRWKLRLAATWAAGSGGLYGVDYLVLAPARRRACSPSGKANDSSYPRFLATTADATRRIGSDLSGATALGPQPLAADTGLGGTPLEGPAPPAGASTQDLELTLKLSSLVPDDPTSDATSEQLAHAVSAHIAVVPRFYLARAA